MDEFRVYRGPLQYKTELRNYDDALSEMVTTFLIVTLFLLNPTEALHFRVLLTATNCILN